jgi:hypothetical protein
MQWSFIVSRVIHIESAGKDRTLLSRHILLAIRELSQSNNDLVKSRDLVAFIIIALGQITQTIDSSVAAWEKRGYWVKADRFRMEWGWTQVKSDQLYKDLQNQNWDAIVKQVILITQKLSAVKLPARKSVTEPWKDAYQLLMRETQSK